MKMSEKPIRRNGKSKYVGQILKGFEIIEYIPASGKTNAKFVGKCVHCGNIITRSASGFTQEKSRIVCPCQEKYSHHGKSHTRLYTIHQNMKRRCYNPKNKWYYLYGGKGIRVCDEWSGKYGFVNFAKWAMENGYSDELTIDRIDSDGNYEPSNCRWATPHEQNMNRETTWYATIDGIKKPVMEWCELYGIKYQCVRSRVNRGWEVEKAITVPSKERK